MVRCSFHLSESIVEIHESVCSELVAASEKRGFKTVGEVHVEGWAGTKAVVFVAREQVTYQKQ